MAMTININNKTYVSIKNILVAARTIQSDGKNSVQYESLLVGCFIVCSISNVNEAEKDNAVRVEDEHIHFQREKESWP